MSRVPGADNSGILFDHIKERKKLKREGDLAKFLDEHPSVISEIRHGKRTITADLLVRICEKTGTTLKAAKGMIEIDRTVR